MTDYQNNQQQQLVPGRYMARATGDFQYGESRNGNTMIWVAFEITEGDYTGWTVYWLCVLVEGKDNRNAITGMQNAGIAMDPATGELYVANPKTVELVIDWDEYNGRSELKVKWVNAPGAVRFKHSELPPDKKACISQALRNSLGALAVPRQVPQRRGGTQRPSPMPKSQSQPQPDAHAQPARQSAPAPDFDPDMATPGDEMGGLDEIPF